MFFRLTKATPRSTGQRRSISGWLRNSRNSSKVVVPAGQNYQKTPADNGLFGLLVSRDATRESWF